MYKQRRIAVVVPAHNEEKHIAKVIGQMPAFVDGLIVVDDYSQDSTAATVDSLADPRVQLLRSPANLGVGGAVVLGYRKALEMGFDIVVKMDGDGQMDPELLPPLLDALIDQAYDYAKGNRFLASESLAFMPRHRLIGNIGTTFLTKLASGYWHIFDPQNGFTAIQTKALQRLRLASLHPGFFFENDMLCHLSLLGLRVKDVAMPARYGDEKSDLNPWKIGLTFPRLLLQRFLRRIYEKYILRDFSPIALFLIAGLLTFGWGACFGAYLWISTLITGKGTPSGTIMLALLPLIMGFQFLLHAILLDIQETPK